MNNVMRLWWRLVRFGFRLLYNELAWTYDAVSVVVSLGQWRCWTRQALAELPPPEAAGRVLELAHGTGNLQLDLHTSGYDRYGYDLSPAMGRIASDKLHRAGFPQQLVRGPAQALPFAAASFGAVVCTFPTPFIYEAETLYEVARVLQPCGVFVMLPSATLTGGSLAERFIERLYAITGQRAGSPLQELADMIADFGFTTEVVMRRCQGSLVYLIVAHKS